MIKNECLDQIDITHKALIDVSSVKIDTSAKNLIDDNFSTFWQTFSWSPHVITATFTERMEFTKVELNLSLKMDATYTPTKILSVGKYNLECPEGWMELKISSFEFVKTAINYAKNLEEMNTTTAKPYLYRSLEGVFIDSKIEKKELYNYCDAESKIKGSCLQIIILANEQNGQDSHVRGIKIFAKK